MPVPRFTVAPKTAYDEATGLTWQRTPDDKGYPWVAANAACAGLALEGGGWRLPSIRELLSIVDASQPGNGYVDTVAFPGSPAAVFWSATAYSGSASSAWFVHFFGSGYSNLSDITSTYRVRCVR